MTPLVSTWWRLELAWCLHILGELDAAVNELNGVLELEGLETDSEAIALLALARIALTQGRYPDAEHLQLRALHSAVLAASWVVPSDAPSPSRRPRSG